MIPNPREVEKMAGVKAIMESINGLLETSWSRKQLACGKWFEIQKEWPLKTVGTLVMQYRDAGWSVMRRAELSQDGTRVFLVIGHPVHFDRDAASRS